MRLTDAQIYEIEKGFTMNNSSLEEIVKKLNCKIVFDNYDDEWNRATDIQCEDKKYRFCNGIHDDSFWDL